jgi:DNA-binding phage protein
MTLDERNLTGRSTISVRNYRTLEEVTEEYLCEHLEEIGSFVSILFEEYAQDGDTAALLSALECVSHVKGVNLVVEGASMNGRGKQGAFSENGDARFGNVNAIMHAMGYWLAPQKLQAS